MTKGHNNLRALSLHGFREKMKRSNGHECSNFDIPFHERDAGQEACCRAGAALFG